MSGIKMINENVLDLTDIEAVSCICSQCQTEMILKLSTAKFHGNECQNCGNGWYPLDEVIGQLRAAFQKAASAKLKLRFRVPATVQTKS